MPIRQRIIADDDLDGFSLEEMECISCSGACGSKVYALRDGKPFVLCGNSQETADFLVSFNSPEGTTPPGWTESARKTRPHRPLSS